MNPNHYFWKTSLGKKNKYNNKALTKSNIKSLTEKQTKINLILIQIKKNRIYLFF